jgi:hypothetical protein
VHDLDGVLDADVDVFPDDAGPVTRTMPCWKAVSRASDGGRFSDCSVGGRLRTTRSTPSTPQSWR